METGSSSAAAAAAAAAAVPDSPVSSASATPHPSPAKATTTHRSPRRSSATHHSYHTFPTLPPKPSGPSPATTAASRWGGLGPAGRNNRPDNSPTDAAASDAAASDDDDDDDDEDVLSVTSSCSVPSSQTPLPARQLVLVALLSLLEQTALNSIAPYLPAMVASFPGVPKERTGLYVGIVGSAFALAQLATNLTWGYLSDVHGRKPVLLAGTALLAGCFVAFGFCSQYWHVVLVQAAMGFLNGNAAVVPAVFGELTDRSNQTTAFKWLPVLYTIGSITGPALGGLASGLGLAAGYRYPYLAPNLISAALLAVGVVPLAIWFEETRPEEEVTPWWRRPAWFSRVAAWMRSRRASAIRGRASWSSRWPRRDTEAVRERRLLLPDPDSDSSEFDSSDEYADPAAAAAAATISANGDGIPPEAPPHGKSSDVAQPGRRPYRWKILNDSRLFSRLNELCTPATVVLLVTLFFFHMSLVSFNSLYPVFAAAPPPTGRGLPPGLIGGLLSAAGVATAVFQMFLYEPLKRRTGNLGTYRASLLGFAVSMALIPWVGYRDDEPAFGRSGEAWLDMELCVVLVVKNMASVAGLASVMLLITNSAPSSDSLGTLNGVAYTLAAAGRSFGPFFSGALFTLATGIHPKGEALTWGIFGGIALVGWACTFAIRGDGLESDDYADAEEDGPGNEEV